MRRIWLLTVPLLLAACGSDGRKAEQPTTTTAAAVTTTTEDQFIAAYCRVMERTDVDYRSGDLVRQSRAEQERIQQAPFELQDEYAHWSDAETGIPNDVIVALQDWTQEHCGFLPTFDL